MSSSAFVSPAHFDLVPDVMVFNIVATHVLRDIIPGLDLKYAYKASSRFDSGICGYYKIEANSGERFFAKIKPSARAAREVLAAEISTELFQRGACTLPLLGNPIPIAGGTQIFIYPWVNGIFFDGSAIQINSLGRELAVLHNALKRLPVVVAETKNIIDVWKAPFEMVRHTSFALEYEASLCAAEDVLSQSPGCLAHNDLHRGNILFTNNGNIAAFIDFEDSIRITSSVLVDLSTVIERFCLWPKMSTERVALFLASYLRFADEELDMRLFDLVQIGICRCFYALGILYSSPEPDNSGWQLEVEKFHRLVKIWESGEKQLLEVIPGPLT